MNIGDKVIYVGDCLKILDMFPKKYELAEEVNLELNSTGVIEELFNSGSGIVKFDNSKRVLFFNIKRDFILNS